MTTARGFWSYTHADDAAEGGSIARLARDIKAQYELITADVIELFIDRDSLKWGHDWRRVVDDSLSATAFFIPVLTPRFIQSAECRRELNYFVRRAQQLGLEKLIMPILWVDFPALHEDPPTDGVIELIKPFQWENWTELRHAESSSSDYRRAVAKMATRLAEANAEADRADIAGTALQALKDDRDDSPGTVDLMARAEESLPEWAETVQLIGQEIENIGRLMQAGTDELNTANVARKGFAGRLVVLRNVARELEGPSTRIRDFGDEFTRQLNDVDRGITVIIQNAPAEIEGDPATKEGFCEFFYSIREMASSADDGLGSLSAMIDAIKPVEAMSRDLREPLRTLRRGLTAMHEGRQVINSWIGLIDDTGIECGSLGSVALDLE